MTRLTTILTAQLFRNKKKIQGHRAKIPLHLWRQKLIFHLEQNQLFVTLLSWTPLFSVWLCSFPLTPTSPSEESDQSQTTFSFFTTADSTSTLSQWHWFTYSRFIPRVPHVMGPLCLSRLLQERPPLQLMQIFPPWWGHKCHQNSSVLIFYIMGIMNQTVLKLLNTIIHSCIKTHAHMHVTLAPVGPFYTPKKRLKHWFLSSYSDIFYSYLNGGKPLPPVLSSLLVQCACETCWTPKQMLWWRFAENEVFVRPLCNQIQQPNDFYGPAGFMLLWQHYLWSWE